MSEETVTMIVQYAVKVIAVIVLFYIAYRLAGWAGKITTRNLEKRKFDPTLSRFFGVLLRWGIIIMAALGCLGVFGVQTASFAAVIAASGLAIGLAFQGSLSNFAAGVMLLIFRPYKVGDVVSVGGQVGKVDELGLFVTTLDTPDNRRIIMPNTSVFGTTIENITFHEKRRVDVAVGTDYGEDLDKVRSVLEEAVKGIEGVLEDPPPQIFLDSLGASSIDWQVRVWCKTADYWDVKQLTTRATKVALDKAEIGIPFPQMDVHFDEPMKLAK